MVTRVHARCGERPELDAIDVLATQGLLALAINALDLRFAQLPADPRTLVNKANLMISVLCPARAIPLLRRALELGADASEVAIDLGVALASSGDPEAALHLYQTHLQTEMDSSCRALMLGNIANCLTELDRVDEAEPYHRRAIEADPAHLGIRKSLLSYLLWRQRHADALEVIDETIALASIQPHERDDMRACRAETLLSVGRVHEALDEIDASLAGDPIELVRLGTRARILVELGRRRAARACATRILGIDPYNELARGLLAMLNRGVRTSN